MNRILFAVIGALCLSCAPAQTVAPAKAPGRYVEHLKMGDLDRMVILHVPPGYDGSRPIPVVVVLHGWTASAVEAEIYTRMAEEGDRQGFASVFPDGEGKKGSQGWNAGFINLSGVKDVDDVGFVTQVLDKVESEVNTDRSREYVCGHSNGAFLANLVGSQLSNRLAAIGSVAGTIGLSGSNAKTIPDPAGPISAILIHGRLDNMVAFGPGSQALLRGVVGAEGSALWWAQKNGCSPVPLVTKSPDGNVFTTLYHGGRQGTEVELVTIVNGGHNWPGGYFYNDQGQPALETKTGVNAADVLWSFFKAHPKR